MTSQVDLVNQAASQMGARAQATSINPSDGSLLGDVGSLLYQTLADATARAAHWNCLRLQRQLTVLKAAPGTAENVNGTTLPYPPIPFLYEYALPDDCLLARFVMPMPNQLAVSPPLTTGGQSVMSWCPITTAIPFVPAVDYNTDNPPAQIRVLLTNAPKAQLVYTARIDNPDLWDAQYKNAVIAVLSAWFVNPLNMNAQLLQQRIGVATGLIAAARISDGNEGIQDQGHIPDWLKARWASGGTAGTDTYIAGWQSIGMPDGQSF